MSKRLSIIIVGALTSHAAAQPAPPAPGVPAPAAPAPTAPTASAPAAPGSAAAAPAVPATSPAQAAPDPAATATTAAPMPQAQTPTVAQMTASPWGSSPYVVAYEPPAVRSGASRAHRGLTLEVAIAAGTTTVDESAGGASFGIGLWVTRDLALTFRATDTGSIGFVGASAQYYVGSRAWIGGGVGQLSEEWMDFDGYSYTSAGGGGFVRAGYNIGQSGRHALTLSGELQMGAIEQVNRFVGLFAIGYQLL